MKRLLVVAIALALGSAHADEPAPPEAPAPQPIPPDFPPSTPPPWAKGVSDADKAKALDLLKRGNALFSEARYAEARALWEQAVEHYDHPSIRYNLARALIQLQLPLLAWQSLERALRFGMAPFRPGNFKAAADLRKSLRAQLSQITIELETPGAVVLLDGKTIDLSSGPRTTMIAPGPHVVSAEKPGMAKFVRRIDAKAAGEVTVQVTLLPPPKARDIDIATRWPTWVPWAIAGLGAAASGTGVFLAIRSNENFDRFDRRFADECPTGCPFAQLTASSRDLHDRADRQKTAAIITMSAGAAVLAGGVVMLLLNQPEKVERAPVRPRANIGAGTASVGVELDF